MTGSENGNRNPNWSGHSIRTAAIGILKRTPGRIWSAQEIAETLIAEEFPFKEKPVKMQRLRETVSAVLGQHIAMRSIPQVEKPEPARYVLVQQDVFTPH
jgi:hypothetical protein